MGARRIRRRCGRAEEWKRQSRRRALQTGSTAHAENSTQRNRPVAMASKLQKIMTQPINLIFRFLQNKSKIKIWLFNNNDLSIEGQIIGFDEYMNLVLDNAEEVNAKKKTRKALGRVLLKGENITLMQVAEGGASMSE